MPKHLSPNPVEQSPGGVVEQIPGQAVLPLRVAVEALGCRLNHAEATTLRMQLQQQGFCLVPWGAAADVQVVNACTVTAQADAKTRHLLRKAKRRNPQSKVVVMGCGAESQGAQLIQQGIVDASIQNGAKHQAANLIKQWLQPSQHPSQQQMEDNAQAQAQASLERMATSAAAAIPTNHTAFALATDANGFQPNLLQTSNQGVRASLKIQDGCNFSCAFCIIPRVRGRPRSRVLADLLQEARTQAQNGVKELVLTGVNLGLYEHQQQGLLTVVDALNALEGLERIRLSSLEPTTVDEGLLARMANPQHKLVPFLHLPLQSGAKDVLHAMRRRYSPREYVRFAQQALRRVPQLGLGADVMCGFPAESEEHFAQTLALIDQLPFAYLHVFPFSSRAKTLAARLDQQVPAHIIKQRAAQLRKLSQAKQREFQTRHLGRRVRVLFESPQGNSLIGGYTPNYLRVEIHTPNAKGLKNTIADVEVLEAGGHAVTGVLV